MSVNYYLYTSLITVSTIARGYPKALTLLSYHLDEPKLQEFIQRFLYDQLYPDAEVCGMDALIDTCPALPPDLRINIYHSASATYYAPSDLSGIGGMHREYIKATPSWKGKPRYDCIFIDKEPELDGFAGLHVARAKTFLSFSIDETFYPCALVEWFSTYGPEPCNDTGLWRVIPDYDRQGERSRSLVHLDTVLRGAHLIGISGPHFLPRTFIYSDSLDAFHLYYVNKYIDHHAHQIAF